MIVDAMLVPISLFICVAVTAIGVPIARAYARRVEHTPVDPSLPRDFIDRMERMEQAIDSIAVEIERISEGQRFTTKLLSERNNSALPSVPERQP